MNVFFGAFLQESNTFSPKLTDIEMFKRGYFWEDEEILSHTKGTNTELAGFLQYFSDTTVRLSSSVACWSVAGGKIKDQVYQAISEKLCEKLRQALPVDGVFLALHGAMVAESIDDCEGDLLSKVRAIVGPRVPVAISLDYHANLTEQMLDAADVMVGFRTYPHVDFAETGNRAAQALDEMMRTGLRPQKLLRKLPLIVPVEDTETGRGICKAVVDRLQVLDRQTQVLSCSLFCPQPWLDIAETGVALVLYMRDNASLEAGQAALRELGDYLMENKAQFFRQYPSIESALSEFTPGEKPVILVDSGDITTAGGIGDSTVALRAVLQAPFQVALCMVSTKAVAQAFAAGVGACQTFTIGGEIDYGYNTDVCVPAQVMGLSRCRSEVRGKSFSGIKADSGRRAYLKIGENIHVVVAEYATLMYDPQFLRDLDVEPSRMNMIIQKSHKLFRAAYQAITQDVIILDTPGFTDQNLCRLEFRHVPRSFYPFCASV